MEVLASIQTGKMDADDPQREFILQVRDAMIGVPGRSLIPIV